MRYALLGRTGVQVSRLALGTMAFGGDASAEESAAIWARARAAGINFVDTADVYNDGRAEEVLGSLLESSRDEIVLATKAYYPMGQDRNARGGSRYHLVRAVEQSLRRLRTDRIDVYYLHHFDDDTPTDESLRALDDLVHQGKILYPACSNFAAWQVAHALGLSNARRLAPFAALQPMYNLLKRQAEVELLPMAQALGLGVVTYGPTAGGLLTGKYAGGARPADARFATARDYQERYGASSYWETAEAFATLAAQLGHRPATLAVAWTAAHPAVTSVLLGARRAGQLEDTLAAADVALDGETWARVAALTPAPAPATDRSEERPAPQRK